MIDVTYPNVLNLLNPYKLTGRTDSASLLIWYFVNYYRLDEIDAIDSVCDQNGDKGVDGIYLNELEETIEVFQMKLSQKPASTIGDSVLREFKGTLQQFENGVTLQNLLDTAGEAQVAGLIRRLDLIKKIESYKVKGIFVCNSILDTNGQGYLNTIEDIEFVGKDELENEYISDIRDIPLGKKAVFDVSDITVSEYFADTKTKALIAPIKAKELVRLEGIQDQSLFAYNVRGPLGKSGVNKDIVRSIKNPASHKNFPLFHNGITIISNKVEDNENEIEIESYFVVNGCQSLTSLYENRRELSDDLKILTKFLQIEVNSELASTVTKFSNNQNGIKARDFKSNSNIQIRIQNGFKENYGSEYFYEVKRGEYLANKDLEIISNEYAGIYLMSFDIKEPWNTHRKYQVFDERHNQLFGRPEVTEHRILMLHIIDCCIYDFVSKINNQLFGKYALTRYAIIYILRNIFENDEIGKALLVNPQAFVQEPSDREIFTECLNKLLDDISVDINAFVDELGVDFDYKSKIRDDKWVKSLSKDVVSTYLKVIKRPGINSFGEEWKLKKATT